MKHTITHACGHTITHDIFGRVRDRDGKERWLAERPCLSCCREGENAANAQAAAKAGLPALTGSEKQVAWATTVRQKLIGRVRAAIANAACDLRTAGFAGQAEQITELSVGGTAELSVAADMLDESAELVSATDDDLAEELTSIVAACRAWVGAANGTADARWWIDHRDLPLSRLPGLLAERHKKAEEEKAEAINREAVEAYREEIRARVNLAMSEWQKGWTLQVGTWSDCKRAYFGYGHGNNVAVLHVTGDRRNSPGSLERARRELDAAEAEALKAILAEVAAKYNAIAIEDSRK